MSIDPNDLLLGGGITAAKFPTIGTIVKGVVVRSEASQQTEFGSNKPKVYDDGNPIMQVIVTLQTDERDGSEDDGQRKLYVRGQMMAAVSSALKAASAKLEVGGTLAVRYESDKPAEKPGFNPAKQYVAQYAPPTQGAELLAAASTGIAADDLI